MRLLLCALIVCLVVASPSSAKTEAEKQQERAEKAARDAKKNAPAEVSIPGATWKQSRAALIQVLSENGCQPVDLGEELLTFEKSEGTIGSAIAGALIGTPYGGNPTAVHRITFLMDDPDDVVVIRNTMVQFVVNEHLSTAFRDDRTKKSKPKMQDLLDRVAALATQRTEKARLRAERDSIEATVEESPAVPDSVPTP